MVKRHGVTDFLSAFQSITSVFFDAETDLLIVLDEQGNVERVNPAFERVLHRPEYEMLGRPLIAIVHEQDFAKFMRAFYDVLRSEPFHLLRRNSGLIKVRLVNYKFIKHDDRQRGFLILRQVQ